MPKKISQKYIETIDQLDDEKYGVRLAKASIAAEIPMSYLAKSLWCIKNDDSQLVPRFTHS